MYYASVGVLALILHLIINKEALKPEKDQPVSAKRYRQFLYWVTLYFISDILWGIFYELRIIPLAYADTFIYFLLMIMTVIMWVRYVVVYLDKSGRFNRILRNVARLIVVFVLLHLVVNFFYPLVFSFSENGDYIPGPARHVTLALQFAMYLLTSVYTLYLAFRSEEDDKIHYMAVGFTCIAMEVLVLFQAFNPLLPYYAMGCLIEICILHTYFERDEKQALARERKEIALTQKEKEIYDQIASSLSEDYEAIYYIDIETGQYMEFSVSKEYEAMNVPMEGEDFYVETFINVGKYVHPDDRVFAQSLYHKDTMLKNLEGKNSYSYKYRIMVGDEARYYRFTVMLAYDKKHFVLLEKDIQDEITVESILMENQKHHATYTQIAESLASNYDVIYYVDVNDSSYISYETNNLYGLLEANKSGDDFFAESKHDIPVIIHKMDVDRLESVMNRDFLLTALESKKQFSIDYRIITEGEIHNVRLSARKSSDSSHFIIGVENVDEEVRKEKEHLRALNTEKELARRDELTGTKNKTAYTELEKSVQANMDNGMDYLPYGIVVCDINDLKKVNDTEGHKAGDDYIKSAAKLLCDTFDHSPVFRVGGDEFVIFLRGNDYVSRQKLIEDFKALVEKNAANGSGPVIAVGMSEYMPETDTLFSEVFERADSLMYQDKQKLKAGE